MLVQEYCTNTVEATVVMKISSKVVSLKKRVPLTISRGTSAGSDNLIVEIECESVCGIGEMAPVNIGGGEEDAAVAAFQVDSIREDLFAVQPWEMDKIQDVLCGHTVSASTAAAIDFAAYDWLGKRAGMPVYQLLGADISNIVDSSLTIGICSPEEARNRALETIARLQPHSLKVKLGSPSGTDADKAMLSAIVEAIPSNILIRVDANGGWDVNGSKMMMEWLAQKGVEYIEQPLPLGQEEDLPFLFKDAPLPIFADESCRNSADIPKLADRVHGINLKLMKSGGIREGLKLIHTARAHGLKVMMGCMSESSLAIAGSVHISAFADYLDLDSHLNLLPDPAKGLFWKDGRVLPGSGTGLGIEFEFDSH